MACLCRCNNSFIISWFFLKKKCQFVCLHFQFGIQIRISNQTNSKWRTSGVVNKVTSCSYISWLMARLQGFFQFMPRITKNIFSKIFEQVGCVIQKRNTYFNLLYLSFSSCNSGDSHSNDSISNTENLKNFISEINFFNYEKNLYLFLSKQD